MTEFLAKIEKELIEQGGSIKFKREREFSNFKEVIATAIDCTDTWCVPPTCKKATADSNYFYTQSLGSSRSIQDLFLLCKHYFPATTMADISAYLRERYLDRTIMVTFCYEHKKMMFINNTEKYRSTYHSNSSADNQQLNNYIDI